MRAFEAGGVPHRTRDLCAYDQFMLLRAVMPILPAVVGIDLATGSLDAAAIAISLGDVVPSDITVAFEAAASAAERETDVGWVSATKAVALPDMLTIVLAVVEANFAGYFARTAPSFRPMMGRQQEFEPVFMPDGESWLFRPCLSDPPLIDMLALYDGRAKIDHVAKANDLLDVQAENEARAMKAAERKH